MAGTPNQPECPGCRLRDQRIADLEAQVTQLTARLKELEQKFAKRSKNSQTSSKPPSSDVVKPPRARRKKSGKSKQGGQPGHSRHDRTLLGEDELDHIWEWRYPNCPCCSGPLQDTQQQPHRHQTMELTAHPVQVDEHRRIVQWCPRCRREYVPQLPEALQRAGLIGPRLTALVGWLKGVCHMSFSSIRKYFRDVIGVPVSRGMLAKVVQKVSRSIKDPYDELLELVSQEDHLNVDETGHWNNGRRLWTWCFRARLYSLFKISPSRGSDVLMEVLGAEFDGILGCDYFSAYRKYMRLNENVALQFCLAHLIRDIKFLVEHPHAANREYGSRLLGLMRKLFHVIHRRDEYATDAGFQLALTRIRNEICWEAGMQSVDTPEARNMAERFYQHVDSYFQFITTPGIEPTNNLAEQAIRFVAIHRRMTQGTRSDKGQHWFERICTVAVTCEQQTRSAFEFLYDAVSASFNGQAAPSLIAGIDTG